MSKWQIGRWDDGTPRYAYFVRRKHHHKRGGIRWIMWKARAVKWDYAIYKKYNINNDSIR